MKVLQIGLGSMGKRRIRNMQAFRMKDIVGFDFREDRRKEAEDKYGIQTVDTLSESLLKSRDVFVVSTPPDRHNECMKLALQYRKPAFVEASVISKGLLDIDREASKKKVRIMPSCTMRFHPSIKSIKKIVQGGKYGKVCNFSYHMGQYLPDWHPWEHIKQFYVSNRQTSASREMVPFELTWMLDVLGTPKGVFAFRGKTHDMGIDIDDTYALTFDFKSFYGTLMVDVVSRFATRSLILNLEKGQIRWNWEDKGIRLYEATKKKWSFISNPEGKAAKGYNVNIIEDMYVDEMKTFFKALKQNKPFTNTLKEDVAILDVLEMSEHSGIGKQIKKA